jgi:branched-chain amino acid transport system ATP-binding protein
VLLQVEDLRAAYGSVQALHGVSFHVKEGEIVALIGANGAGKSTTLMTIHRLPPPEAPVVKAGRVLYRGEDLLKYEPHQLVERFDMAMVPEGRRIFGNLTVQENLELATYTRKKRDEIREDLEKLYILFPRLEERKRQRGSTLSGGEQQMLAVGRALMTGARFILLDEPSMGLAPLLMQELFRVLKELNENGTTILVVEQNARLALKYAHRAYVMETGRIVMEGTAAELLNNAQVIKAYLGG